MNFRHILLDSLTSMILLLWNYDNFFLIYLSHDFIFSILLQEKDEDKKEAILSGNFGLRADMYLKKSAQVC